MCVIYCAFQLNVSFISSRAFGIEMEIAMKQPPAPFPTLTSFDFKSNLRSSCENYKQSLNQLLQSLTYWRLTLSDIGTEINIKWINLQL